MGEYRFVISRQTCGLWECSVYDKFNQKQSWIEPRPTPQEVLNIALELFNYDQQEESGAE